jgi:arginine decarboxylase
MIFTPAYYGVSANVAALADVAHSHDVPLLTDDAWGLAQAFCSRLPPSAMESGPTRIPIVARRAPDK